MRGQIYGELFRILKPSSSGPRYGEDAFHDQKDVKFHSKAKGPGDLQLFRPR